MGAEKVRPNWIARAWFRVWCWLALSCGVYYLWSRVYRWLYQRAYRGHVKAGVTLAILQQRAQRFSWRRDDGRALRDAIGLPLHLEAFCFGDCDEFSAWWCDAGRNGFKDSQARFWKPIGILTVRWLGKGHNVALVRVDDEGAGYRGSLGRFVDLAGGWPPAPGNERRDPPFAHVSNWGAGRLFDGHQSIEDIAWHVAGERDAVPLALSLVSPDLKTRITYKWIGGKRG